MGAHRGRLARPVVLLFVFACAQPPQAAPAAPTTGSPPPPPAPPAPAFVSPPPATFTATRRTVAIGDTHGDPDALERVLRLAGLVDAAGAWTGGDATVVLTGDMVDRGPSSKGVLARARRLVDEAAAGGGRAVILLGNHEVMNLEGDWRYVSPEDLAEFGGDAARHAAFAPTGAEGAWVRTLPAVAKVGDTVFVHGGIDAHWAALGVDALNTQIRAGIGVDPHPAILGSDGPLWNRSYLLADPAQACPELDRALTALGARRMVVGHTRQDSGRIAERCDGKLYGIDTGLSRYYGGDHSAALEVRGDTVTELYPTP